MNVMFATNRNGEDDKIAPKKYGIKFNDDHVHGLRFGKASGSLEEFKDEKMNIETYVDNGDLGSVLMFKEIKESMINEKIPTLVFIHGYNTTFNESIRMAALLKDNFEKGGNPMNVVVFSWPSNGSNLYWDYSADRHDAEASGVAFARALLKMAKFLKEGEPCGQDLYLMAHSMGNYCLRFTFQEIYKQLRSRLPQLFNKMFLIAADEDDNAFEREDKFLHLSDACQELYIYFNKHDKALMGSDTTKGNPDRLGACGPKYPLNIPNKITLIDISKVNSDFLGHNYLENNPRVVADLNAVLSGKLSQDDIPGRVYDQRKNKFRLV